MTYKHVVNVGGFRYTKELVIGAVILLTLTGVYFGYRFYNNSQEHYAHRLFAQNLEEYERVMQEGKAEDWASMETLFKLGYDQYSKSSLAPYFLIYQAESLEKQGKQGSLDLLDKAVNLMSSSSPLLFVYKTKLALMRLDASDMATHKIGVEDLKVLAADTKNPNNDVAAYYLGLFYWTHDNVVKAQEAWKPLFELQKTTNNLGQSPWAALAQEKLAQLA
ncbi:MAG: hypothetical protein NTX86_02485 [Candidatus Dependentiae bacterium]|nr:hypothetical protein [Candidatus Dependentiae bacterium]